MPPRRGNRVPQLEERLEEKLVAGRHMVVGFSGGADSVSLLHRLWQRREALDLTLEAVHLNHGLRGEESDRDEAFVRAFCQERGIPLTVRRIEVAKRAREQGLSLEACGREERYRLFAALAQEAAARGERPVRIATAHTLSDDLETVLFRMARGTGLDGLCGIPLQRGGIVRPLLRCTREMVEDYCRRQGLSFVTDSTNADPSYARNRIRAEAVPALMAANSAALENFLGLRAELEEDRAYLDAQASQLMERAALAGGLDTAALAGQPPVLLSRVAAQLLREGEIPVSRKNVLALSDLIRSGRGRLELRPSRPFVIRRGVLRLEPAAEVDFPPQKVALDSLTDGQLYPIRWTQIVRLDKVSRQQEKKLWLQVITAKDWTNRKKVYENLLFFAVDYDKIIASLVFRSRQPGDTLAECERTGSRTLKKLFNEAGLSALDRQTRLVAADACSVIWAEGFGVDRRVEICPGETRRVLAVLNAESPDGQKGTT